MFGFDINIVFILKMNVTADLWSLLNSSLQSERALLRHRGDVPLQLLSRDQGLTDPPFSSKIPLLFRFVSQVVCVVVCVCVCGRMQMYRWTGENSYFVKGNIDSLQMGGGGYVCTACLHFKAVSIKTN